MKSNIRTFIIFGLAILAFAAIIASEQATTTMPKMQFPSATNKVLPESAAAPSLDQTSDNTDTPTDTTASVPATTTDGQFVPPPNPNADTATTPDDTQAAHDFLNPPTTTDTSTTN